MSSPKPVNSFQPHSFLVLIGNLLLHIPTNLSLPREVLPNRTIRRERSTDLLAQLSYPSTLIELFPDCAILVEDTPVFFRNFLCFAADGALFGEFFAYGAVCCEGTADFLGFAADL